MTARALAGIGILSMCVALVPAASAQEPAPPSIFLRQMTTPVEPPPPGSLTRDDLRDPAPPRPDRLRDAIRFDVGFVGDPRCLPGEELLGPGSINARSPRRPRSR